MPEAAIPISVMAAALSSDVREAARRARGAGFDGLMLDARSPSLDLGALSATGRRDLLKSLSSAEQKLAGLRVNLDIKGFVPGTDVSRAIDGLERAMRSARELQADLVTVDIGTLPPAPKQVTPRPKITPEQAGLILLPESTISTPTEPEVESGPADAALAGSVSTALAEIGRRADRYGVMVAFGNALTSFAALEAALSSVACPWFGVDLDSVAILRDRWSIDHIFSSIGSLIHHVRARDAIRGAEQRAQPAVVGEGDVDWTGLISRLRQIDHIPWMTIDPAELQRPDQAAVAGLSFLRQINRRLR